jgi:multidrug efflux pump subunit AcrA (membrane-fusion protein)
MQHPVFQPVVRWAPLLLLGAVAACGGGEAEATDVAPVTQQIGAENIAVAQTDSIAGGPLLSGALVPEREARIRAEVGGRVTAIMVDAGQAVRVRDGARPYR